METKRYMALIESLKKDGLAVTARVIEDLLEQVLLLKNDLVSAKRTNEMNDKVICSLNAQIKALKKQEQPHDN